MFPRLVLAACLASLMVTGCQSNHVPASTLDAFHNAEWCELLSLDPNRGTDAAGEKFHGWRVLGRTIVADPATQRQLAASLEAAAGENQGMIAMCFNPRHGIHIVYGRKTSDLVICFECLQTEVYEGEVKTHAFLVSQSPQPLFDAVLKKAGVPLASKP